MEIVLSESAMLTLVRGQYGPYVKIDRTFGDERHRWLNVTCVSMCALMGRLSEFNDAMIDCQNYELQTDKVNFSVSEYEGRWYFCIAIKSKDYVNRINLKMAEWGEFMKSAPKIKKFVTIVVKKEKATKKRRRDMAEETIVRTPPQTLASEDDEAIGSTPTKKLRMSPMPPMSPMSPQLYEALAAADAVAAVLEESKELERAMPSKDIKQFYWTDAKGNCQFPFFTEADCKEDYLFVIGSANEPMVLSVSVPFLGFAFWFRQIAMHLCEKEIGKIATRNCGGCAVDSPGQRSHKNEGCLGDWQMLVDCYFQQALLAVDTLKISAKFNDVMIYLERDEIVSSLDVQETRVLEIINAQDMYEIDEIVNAGHQKLFRLLSYKKFSVC